LDVYKQGKAPEVEYEIHSGTVFTLRKQLLLIRSI